MPRRRALSTAAAVAALAVLAYWPIVRHGFINLDDDVYVYENAHVTGGFTAEGARWAFATFHTGNWHPLTWLSHMADCQLFGLDAGRHHAAALALHALNAAVLFLVLFGLTGAWGPSTFVAAMLAVHPVHVESVAWVAERKDLLSMLFGLLSIGAYGRYVRQESDARRRGWYAASLACFVLGLMSKPMLVTLPALLLLLDVWPLARLTSAATLRRLLIEKAPFAVLAAASAVVTVAAQHRGGAIRALAHLPISSRVENAVISAAAYLGKLVYPAGLSIVYPYPPAIPVWKVAVSGALLIAISALVFRFRRTHAHAVVGWLWYAVALLPVIGLVQVGNQSMADRYTYLPSIGIACAVAFGAASWAGRSQGRGRILIGAAVVVVTASLVATRAQVRHWSGSIPLYMHALSVTDGNALVENNLGVALEREGRPRDAAEHFGNAVRIAPEYSNAHFNLANVLVTLGDMNAAESHYAAALRSEPDNVDALTNYGGLLYERGRVEEAAKYLAHAVALSPQSAESHNNLGNALAALGRGAEAVESYREAARLAPNSADAYDNLAVTLIDLARYSDAEEASRTAIGLAPARLDFVIHLGEAVEGQGRTAEAIALYERVLALKPDFGDAQSRLAEAKRKLAYHGAKGSSP